MYFKDWIGEDTDHVWLQRSCGIFVSGMFKLHLRFNQKVNGIPLQLSLISINTALVGHLCHKFQARSSYRGDVESTGSCQTGMRSAAAWTLLR